MKGARKWLVKGDLRIREFEMFGWNGTEEEEKLGRSFTVGRSPQREARRPARSHCGEQRAFTDWRNTHLVPTPTSRTQESNPAVCLRAWANFSLPLLSTSRLYISPFTCPFL